MRRFLLLICLVMLFILPAQAQDEAACDINLLDDIAKLVEAQDQANNGAAASAIQMISEVQAQLDALLSDCAQGNVALPATFEFTDRLFRFNHPDNWARLSPVTDVFVLGNNQAAVNSIVKSNLSETLPAGAQILIAAYGDMKSLFNANNFADFVDQLQTAGMIDGARFSSPEDVVIQAYSGVKLVVESELFSGKVYALDLTENKIALFIALTPPQEFADFEATFEAIVASIQTGAKPVSENPTQTPSTPVALHPGKPLSEITYTQALNIMELIDNVDPHTAVLAPDGTRIAWFERRDDGAICEYSLADKTTQCQPIPEIFNSVAPVILWSPDSRFIAFTQDGFIRFHEPDIWVYDTQSQTFANRTDDHINYWRFGKEPAASDSPGPMWYDHTFTWGSDGNLYFIRFNAPDAANLGEGTTGLFRVSPESGDAQLIRDLTANFDRFSVYQVPQYDLSGVLAVSPDASQIAFIIRENDLSSPDNGVWVMSLTGDEAPQQVLRNADLTPGTIEAFREANGYLLPMALAWTPDQTGIYLFANDPQFQPDATAILYQVDLASGALTPLTDFSSYTRADLFRFDEATNHSPGFDIPRAAVMSPDGTTPLIFNRELPGGQAGLSALLPGDSGVERTILLEFEYGQLPAQISSAAADGKLLLFGMLLLPEA